MPALITLLWSGFLNILGTVVGQVMAKLALASVTYTGLTVTIGWLRDQVVSNVQGLPADVVGMLSYMKVGVALSIVASALVVRMTLGGMSAGGSLSKWGKK